MQDIKSYYDYNKKKIESLSVKDENEVTSRYPETAETQETLVQYLLGNKGVWDDEDVKIIEEIVDERMKLSSNKDEV